MLKKALISLVFACTASTALLSIEAADLQNTVQKVKRAYQKEVIKLKKMELLNADLYAKTAPFITKIIDSAPFKEKMVASITEQYNAIVEQNTPFTAIKQETSLTDFFPNASTNKYMQTLYSFMANKAYCQLLWQKLFAQEKESTQEAGPTEKVTPSETPAEETTESTSTTTSINSEQQSL